MAQLQDFIPLFLNGGWIVPIIGASGMLARLVTSKNSEDKTATQVLSNMIASMVASVIAWFILEQFEIGNMYKAIAYGLVGLNSPEILSGIVKLSTKFAENPSEFISNIRNGKLSKTPIKRTTSKIKSKK
jgi:uncharacterized membrane protein YeaQ/YmgE (transglycosylase-associated protein family)